MHIFLWVWRNNSRGLVYTNVLVFSRTNFIRANPCFITKLCAPTNAARTVAMVGASPQVQACCEAGVRPMSH